LNKRYHQSELKYDYKYVPGEPDEEKGKIKNVKVKNDFVAHILYVPYAIMVPLRSEEKEIDCTELIKEFEDSRK